MTRQDLMKAVIAFYGDRKKASVATGLTPQMVGKIACAKRPMTDDVAFAIVDALSDQAQRCDMLASVLVHHLAQHPRASLRGAGPRASDGKFTQLEA